MIGKRLCVIIALLCVLMSYAQQRAQSIVFINGQRYYVHSVESGQTLYSLSKLYDVSEGDITASNPSVKELGLKSGESIKIPIKGEDRDVAKREPEKKLRKNFNLHTVSQGETLYSISRQYEISVAVIVEDNPDIDPTHLALGQEIIIRKQKMGQGSKDEAIETLNEYTSTLNKVAPRGYEYYVVPPQETLYSLLRRTEMSQQEFSDVNPNTVSALRAGEIVLIRATAEEVSQEEVMAPYYRVSDDDVQFVALAQSDTLNVSLLLPLSTPSGGVTPLFREFYQGFLLGVEELRDAGRNIIINLYDTQRDSLAVRRVAESPEFRRSDLIVGPVYESLLGEVLPIAEQGMIPVVSPLATLKESRSGVLFQMAPVPERRYDKIEDLVVDTLRRITLIYSEHTDSVFEAQVKRVIGEREYNTHLYEYEHPSVIAERVREAIREEREEELEPSPSDLSPLILGDTLTTIFIMSDNETDVDRVLSGLASAKISLKSRTQEVCDFRVVGNPQWNRYPNIDRAMLFSAHLTAFSSYHAKRDSDVVKEFDSRYIEDFGALPSLYSYRGYDVAKIFGEGLYSDIEQGMEGRTFTPLQSTYQFERVEQGQGRANANWIRVNYMPNFTITLE